MDTIRTRRSVRRFTDRDVADDHLDSILDAGMCAPSANDERPWQFIVCRERSTREKLSGVSPYARAALHARLCIVVCGDLQRESGEGYWVQDCSAAIQNMLLEAESLGLGTVWLGVYPLEDRVDYIRNLFGLPPHIIPLAIIPVGYPADKGAVRERMDRSRIHYEHW